MAVGKGSMARASKAADNTSVPKETKRTTAKIQKEIPDRNEICRKQREE